MGPLILGKIIHETLYLLLMIDIPEVIYNSILYTWHELPIN